MKFYNNITILSFLTVILTILHAKEFISLNSFQYPVGKALDTKFVALIPVILRLYLLDYTRSKVKYNATMLKSLSGLFNSKDTLLKFCRIEII